MSFVRRLIAVKEKTRNETAAPPSMVTKRAIGFDPFENRMLCETRWERLSSGNGWGACVMSALLGFLFAIFILHWRKSRGEEKTTENLTQSDPLIEDIRLELRVKNQPSYKFGKDMMSATQEKISLRRSSLEGARSRELHLSAILDPLMEEVDLYRPRRKYSSTNEQNEPAAPSHKERDKSFSSKMTDHNVDNSSVGCNENYKLDNSIRRVSFPDAADNSPEAEQHKAPTRQRRRPSRRVSLSGSFASVDGIDMFSEVHRSDSMGSFSSLHESCRFHEDLTTSVEVVPEKNGFFDDKTIREANAFEQRVLSKITDLSESLQLLRRTRTVAALASRLMAAPDEKSCFEEVTRLLLPLFQVDLASYALLTDLENYIVKKVNVMKREHARALSFEFSDSGFVRPLKGTAVGKCAETLEQYYAPRSKECRFDDHAIYSSSGLNTVLVTPILVNGNKFAGCIILSMEEENAFKEHDRILVSDIAAMLGANIYAKRLRGAAENSNKISQEMLHSLIPAKVIKKIECFWDESSEEYQHRERSTLGNLLPRHGTSTAEDINGSERSGSNGSLPNQISIKVNGTENDGSSDRFSDIRGKLNFLNEVNRINERDDAGVMLDHSTIDLNPTSRALYAENAKDVCIIFTDIVGFSSISLEIMPIEVMDMLQDLFNRFDETCDRHGVLKLETIGDAYICSTGLMDDTKDREGGAKDAALRALAMAKDMIQETQLVPVPRPRTGNTLKDKGYKSLEIRVGIHVGDLTCGVLGQRLPKFTLFGNAVNMAARMEQASLPSKIRVTKKFHDLVKDVETNWEEHSVISVKNMGQVETFLLNPLNKNG